jgi:hypothetical protein
VWICCGSLLSLPTRLKSFEQVTCLHQVFITSSDLTVSSYSLLLVTVHKEHITEKLFPSFFQQPYSRLAALVCVCVCLCMCVRAHTCVFFLSVMPNSIPKSGIVWVPVKHCWDTRTIYWKLGLSKENQYEWELDLCYVIWCIGTDISDDSLSPASSLYLKMLLSDYQTVWCHCNINCG